MIERLPQEIVNKIAAGQVVQRPYNAIKQLIENSIDAGATQINISIANGGLDKIQVSDNGPGIDVKNYPLLCARFATSKIKQLKDLDGILSYGFRGEALASLSYVSRFSVSSKHKDAQCGYSSSYKQQKMVQKPLAIACEVGTKITISDLFMNLSTRRKSMSPLQQKKKIIELVYCISLDYPHHILTLISQKGVEISLNMTKKSIDEARSEIFKEITGLKNQEFTSIKQKINDIQLIGVFSRINCWTKNKKIVLNVNHRLVQNEQITKAIDKGYSECYRSIHNDRETYYCYVSLKMEPTRIDCNVHPTKKVVGFFKTEALYQNLTTWVRQNLQNSSSIRMIQGKKLSLSQKDSFREKVKQSLISKKQKEQIEQTRQSASRYQTNGQYAYQVNRTDSKQIPLQYYFSKANKKQEVLNEQQNQQYITKGSNIVRQKFFKYKYIAAQQRGNQNVYGYIRDFLKHITYVGCFNLSYMCIHFQHKLYMLNILPFMNAYIAQLLKEQAALYLIYPNNPLCVLTIIKQFLISQFKKMNQSQVAKRLADFQQKLFANRQNIKALYGFSINSNLQLQNYPVINKCLQTQPLNQKEFSYFLLSLFSNKNNNKGQSQGKNQNLFIQFLRSPFLPTQSNSYAAQLSVKNHQFDEFMKSEILPTLKLKGNFSQDICITEYMNQMLDLKDAYKMFQRC